GTDAQDAVVDVEPDGALGVVVAFDEDAVLAALDELDRRRPADHDGVERAGRIAAALDALGARSRRQNEQDGEDQPRGERAGAIAHSEAGRSCFETARAAVTLQPSRRRRTSCEPSSGVIDSTKSRLTMHERLTLRKRR